MQDFDVWTVMNKAEKMYEKSPLSVGNSTNWAANDSSPDGDDESPSSPKGSPFAANRFSDQPVPFIRLRKLQNDINASNAAKSLVVVDTRDPVRFKQISIKNSMNLPFDEEFDFTATLYEYKGKMIVLVGDLKICSQLALQLIEIAIPMVCILYDDVEDKVNLKEFRTCFN